jgi:hypothetical protein
MELLEVLGLLGFGLMCFKMGYTLGKDVKK